MAGGEAHEVKGYDARMQLHEIDPAELIGDKGYDSDGIRNDLAHRTRDPATIEPQDAHRIRSRQACDRQLD